MSRPQKNNFPTFAVLSLLAAHFSVAACLAVEATTQVGASAPCAVVENFHGDLEILDPSRSFVIPMGKNVGIPCGGWVSSDAGWAIIRHRDGHDLRIGPNTFIEIPVTNKQNPDQVVLYRGEMFGSTEGGGGLLQIITANARVRVAKGNVLVNYDRDNQDTQLVALDSPASLENRFEPSRKIEVKAGESTSLNFKLLRVVPTFPKAISVAALREKLVQFRLNEKEATEAYSLAQARAERRLASTLEPQEKNEAAVEKEDLAAGVEKTPKRPQIAARKLASEADSAVYSRTPGDSEEGAMLKTHLVRKITADEDVGESILYPDQFHGKPARIKVMVDDPGAKMDSKKHKVEDLEKRKLIDELSQIHED